MSVAVVDLGSNTFNLLVAEVDANGQLHTVTREREPVHLGARISDSGRIDAEGWRRAMVAMAGLVGQARISGAETVVAIATGAVRDAENGAELMSAAGRELDVETCILSPAAAARLAYRGARSESSDVGRMAVVDLGGGSLDVAVGDADTMLLSGSVPVGAQRLRAAVAERGFESVMAEARTTMAPLAQRIRELRVQRVVLASGTARAVHRLVRKRRSVGVGSAWMDRAALHRVARWARAAGPDALAEAGVRRDRVATIAISATLLDIIAELVDASELWLTRRGLREGALLDRTLGAAGGEVGDVASEPADARGTETRRGSRSGAPGAPVTPDHTAV